SRDRRGEHPQAHLAGYVGILQADAYDGYNKLYLTDRKPGPILEAACWVHARRPFFAMADIEENARRKAVGKKEIPLSPIAIEVVRRIDALFAIERSINGRSPEERLKVRRAESQPLVDDLKAYMREQAAKLSRGHDLVKAIHYMLKRWHAFTLFLDDGRVCMSNNAAERGLRCVALGRKSWLFCGSDRGGRRAADMYGLIVTCKMNGVDPQAWLADVLARIAGHPAHRLEEKAVADGYDPMLGIMHYDRDGAPAFVFDMMEPERPKVDGAVLSFLKSEALHPADFTIREDGVVRLNPELARRVARLGTGSRSRRPHSGEVFL